MDRETQTKVLFLSAFAGTGLLYLLTAAEGYPWSASTHWALAWSGVIPQLPHVPHPVWGYFVQVFGGHYIALSIVAAALTVALVASLATRHFGWRIGAAAAVFLGLAPRIWNEAVMGGRFASVLAVGAIALWCLDTWITSIARKYKSDAVFAHGGRAGKLAWLWRIAAWCILGASGVFAAASFTFHNYSIGEDATEYVREILKDADGKWVVMSGMADDQFYGEVRDTGRRIELLSLRTDDLYRTQLVSRVRAAFPGEQDLVNAATVGPRAFMDAGRKAHPDLFVMTDMDRTREKIRKAEEKGGLPPRWRPSLESLVEWNNKMMQDMDAGKKDEAAKLARAILSVPEWRSFIPANVVLGTISGMDGDFVSSERFFRTAIGASTNEPPVVVCNDFAETLRQMKKYDEAEAYARKAIAKGGPKYWVGRLTLIQILKDAKKGDKEIDVLAAEALRYAPEKARSRIREYKGR